MDALRYFAALFALLFPGLACAAQATVTPHVQRTVSPERSREPGLEDAIRRELADNSFVYAYNRVRLSDGPESEFLVYLRGADYCGSGGCTFLVFGGQQGKFRLISRLTLVRTPVIVSSHRTNGWNDLIVFVVGGGIQQGYYSLLPFNGRGYPENPTVKPAMPLRQRFAGIAYLSGADNPSSDIVVSPQK